MFCSQNNDIMKKIIIVLLFSLSSQLLFSQVLDRKNTFFSSSIGITLPYGEYGSVDWFNNNSVGLACMGSSWDIASFGKYFEPNWGLAVKLNSTINPINHQKSEKTLIAWKMAKIGVGGLIRLPREKWDMEVDVWANYAILLGPSQDIVIGDKQIPYFNSLFGGFILEFDVNYLYHLSSMYSVKLNSGIGFSINKLKYGVISTDKENLSKPYSVIDLQIGLVYWIN